MTAYKWIDWLKDGLSFREFEPQGIIDYILIPWWVLRWIFAYLWAVIWYRLPRRFYSRYNCPDPIMCPRCLWAGPYRWLYHGYSACGDDDVEASDDCPRCGREL